MGRPRKIRTDPASIRREHMGKRLRAARMLADLTAAQAANIVGLSLKAYDAQESGQNNVSAEVAYKMFLQTDVPMEFVFAGDLRRAPYGMAAKLVALCAELGAAVGGTAPEFPMESGDRPAAAVPRAVSRGSGSLHEEPGLSTDRGKIR